MAVEVNKINWNIFPVCLIEDWDKWERYSAAKQVEQVVFLVTRSWAFNDAMDLVQQAELDCSIGILKGGKVEIGFSDGSKIVGRHGEIMTVKW